MNYLSIFIKIHLVWFWLSLIFCSCVATEELMLEETLDLKFLNTENCSTVGIHIVHGDVVKVNDCHKKITFHEARGGKMFLFGLFEIQNKSPLDMNFVTISYNDGTQYVTSYNKIKEFQFETVNDIKIYFLDELELIR